MLNQFPNWWEIEEVLSSPWLWAHYPSQVCGSISLLTDSTASGMVWEHRLWHHLFIEENFGQVYALCAKVLPLTSEKSYVI